MTIALVGECATKSTAPGLETIVDARIGRHRASRPRSDAAFRRGPPPAVPSSAKQGRADQGRVADALARRPSHRCGASRIAPDIVMVGRDRTQQDVARRSTATNSPPRRFRPLTIANSDTRHRISDYFEPARARPRAVSSATAERRLTGRCRQPARPAAGGEAWVAPRKAECPPHSSCRCTRCQFRPDAVEACRWPRVCWGI